MRSAIPRVVLVTLLAMAGLTVASSPARAQSPAAAPPAPITQVLTLLLPKPGVDRAQVMKVMPDEVRETVKMHLAGKIQQWYGRSDARGVVFVLNATSVEEAKALMMSLPLGKNGFADFEFIALTPLSPLRLLLDPADTLPAARD
jgi:hypothetical protein